MSSRVLLLSPWMSPIKIISWQSAVTLLYLGKIEVLEEYDDETVSSPSVTMQTPAVVRLKRPMGRMKRNVKFSRINVMLRDKFHCQYCGVRKEMKDLNYDHVVPRVRGGRTDWENIVTSCYPCNERKGPRTLEQAGMRLIRPPTKPKSLSMEFLQIPRRTIPAAWTNYCKVHGIEEDRKSLFLMTGTG